MSNRTPPIDRRSSFARWLLALAGLPVIAVLLIALGVPGAGGSDVPILASYFYSTMSPTHLDALAARGFNVALIKYSIEEWVPEEIDNLTGKVEQGREIGLVVTPVVNAHNRRVLAMASDPARVFHDRRGRARDGVPCPADTSYWTAWWREMVVPAARRASAVAVDFELYGAGDLHHWPPSPCRCPHCVREYTGFTDRNADLAEAWIDRIGERDLEKLGEWQRQRLVALFTRALSGLDERGVRLGVLDLGRRGLVTRALAEALERLAMPVVDFTELTYADGGQVPDDEITATYSGLDVEVRVVPGFWLLKWSPDDLEREAASLGRRHAGYWIFTSLSLHVPPEELEGHYRLNGPQPAYWLALEEANLSLNGTGD